eukprot:scaffold600210_cov36-Prasinocladus_malaysianus.AAC.1
MRICGATEDDVDAIRALDNLAVVIWSETDRTQTYDRLMLNYCQQASAFLVTSDEFRDWVVMNF